MARRSSGRNYRVKVTSVSRSKMLTMDEAKQARTAINAEIKRRKIKNTTVTIEKTK